MSATAAAGAQHSIDAATRAARDPTRKAPSAYSRPAAGQESENAVEAAREDRRGQRAAPHAHRSAVAVLDVELDARPALVAHAHDDVAGRRAGRDGIAPGPDGPVGDGHVASASSEGRCVAWR